MRNSAMADDTMCRSTYT